MTTPSHEESIAACYASWGKDYHDQYYGGNAPYPPVHRDILLRLLHAHGARRILDAGCGSASFMRYLLDDDRQVFGFDLTPEMVDEGKKVLQHHGTDPRRLWVGSVTDPAAYVMPGEKQGGDSPAYDAVICSGVMPHILPEQEPAVLDNLAHCLRPGGLLLLEARNELFALFTQNRFTSEFLRKRCIQEDSLLEKAGEETSAVRQALDDFSSLMRMDLPPQRTGVASNYDEMLSRTHNPFELLPALEKAGFQQLQPHFYHYHCLPPMLAAAAPEFFKAQSIAMENPQDWRGYFMASAFIVSGTRV